MRGLKGITTGIWLDITTIGLTVVCLGLFPLRAHAASVVAWGNNGWGQAEVPPGLTNVIAVAAGTKHSLALKADGTVVGWGDDEMGLKNPPPGLTNVIAIAAGASNSLALKADGSVVVWVSFCG
jgi:alpha-tubulin suppressor-like RCC1 family protein